MAIPICAAAVSHIHITNVILTSSNKKVVRDDNASHWTEEDAPAAQHRDKCSRVGDIIPRADYYRDDCQDIAASSDIDPLRA